MRKNLILGSIVSILLIVNGILLFFFIQNNLSFSRVVINDSQSTYKLNYNSQKNSFFKEFPATNGQRIGKVTLTVKDSSIPPVTNILGSYPIPLKSSFSSSKNGHQLFITIDLDKKTMDQLPQETRNKQVLNEIVQQVYLRYNSSASPEEKTSELNSLFKTYNKTKNPFELLPKK